MLSKHKYHIDVLPVPIHLSLCVLLDIVCPLLEKKRLLTTRQMTHCFYPPLRKNLIDPPPPSYRDKKCNSTARPKLMRGKSASEHNFLGVGCTFRVFQGTFPGAKNSRVFRVFQSLLATLLKGLHTLGCYEEQEAMREAGFRFDDPLLFAK